MASGFIPDLFRLRLRIGGRLVRSGAEHGEDQLCGRNGTGVGDLWVLVLRGGFTLRIEFQTYGSAPASRNRGLRVPNALGFPVQARTCFTNFAMRSMATWICSREVAKQHLK